MNMNISSFQELLLKPVCLLTALVCVIPNWAQAHDGGTPSDNASIPTESVQADHVERLTRDGVTAEFRIKPVSGLGAVNNEIFHGDYAEVSFSLTSAETGEPLRRVPPGVWVDLAKTWQAKDRGPVGCKDRVSLYLQGMVGIRPLIDLNSYYILVLNQDATISVIDPVVGVTGITSLYATVKLPRPGADWIKTKQEKWLYVSMPRANEVAVVNLDTFKMEATIPAGDAPARLALEPGEQYLWVANDAKHGHDGSVTVIDLAARKSVATIPVGKGHHEIVFSDDRRFAFVTNRESGTVSVIDATTRKLVRDITTGPVPISLAVSPLSKSLYVADGESGAVRVIDPDSGKVLKTIILKSGIGPLKFSLDGRWGISVNPVANEVVVIDASTNTIAHRLSIEGKPFQIGMSSTFAYIRSLDSERVSMINLATLSGTEKPVVNSFAAGSKAPSEAKDLSLAAGIAQAAQEAAMLVVSPGDDTVYYYMEGMNAPMGAFQNYGHRPRAVDIANRALKETAPGVYTATIRIPTSGSFDVGFLNEAPRFLHCFSFEAKPNPLIKTENKALAVNYLVDSHSVKAGSTMALRFRLNDPATGNSRPGLTDVSVLYYRAPNFGRRIVPARHVENGIYEAELAMDMTGAYYVFVGVPSAKLSFKDLNYMTVMAVKGEQ